MQNFKRTVEISEGSQSSHQNGNHSTYGVLHGGHIPPPLSMNSVLLLQVVIERLVVVDISPLNPHVELDPTDKSEWNMEHYFHSMKAVHFDQSLSMSKVAY